MGLDWVSHARGERKTPGVSESGCLFWLADCYTRRMSLKIDQDHSRFRNIVRGKIRQNLRKYISHGELIGRKGKDLVSIPIPQIDIPRFRFGDKQQGGVGQGDGEPGDPVGGDDGRRARAGQQAGQDAGEHVARGRRHARRARGHPRRGARAARHPGQGQEQDHQRQGSLHRHPPRRARVAAPLQAHLPRGAEAHDRRAAPSSPTSPIVVPIPDDKRYRSLEDRRRARRQRRHHLHDGRVRLDGRRAEGDRPHRVASGSIRGCKANTRASRAATSSTTPSRARSIATRSSTRASRAAR